jgi:hypothetical protein
LGGIVQTHYGGDARDALRITRGPTQAFSPEGFMFHLVALGMLLGAGMDAPPTPAQTRQDYKISARTRNDYNHLRMQAHGTVYKGMLYGFFDDDWALTDKDGNPWGGPCDLNAIPLAKIDKMNWKKYPLGEAGYNYRHHVGYGALWFSRSNVFLHRWDFDHIPEFLRRSFGPADATGRDMVVSGIVLLELWGKYNKIGQAAIDAKEFLPARGEPRPLVDFVAWDSVPVSKDTCKTFILEKKAKKFEVWDSQGAVNQRPGPYEVRPKVKNIDTFESPSSEDFYAFVRKDHYYFVTESGKLYHAPPAKEGEKSRTMKALWTDAKRPIVAVIEDADNDKVWLFAKDKNAGAKLDLYFEMKDTIRTETFDPTKLRPVNVEGRAKTLLEYLPLISADAKKK